MALLYEGFTVHRLGLSCYLVIGPGLLRGWYVPSESEAMKIIDGFIAGQCTE